MSAGTMCLTCRAYIGSEPWHCKCEKSVPSDDGNEPNASSDRTLTPAQGKRISDERLIAHLEKMHADCEKIPDASDATALHLAIERLRAPALVLSEEEREALAVADKELCKTANYYGSSVTAQQYYRQAALLRAIASRGKL